MSEHFYLVAVALGAVCVLTIPIMAIIALCLGRGLRAQGIARIGHNSELSVHVEVPSSFPDLGVEKRS
jgi:hypothetical protein